MTEKTKEKPLEKMTAKDLRELAGGMEEIVGAHGMNKAELISAIKKVRGISENKSGPAHDMRDVKTKIKALKNERRRALAEKDKGAADLLRRRLNRLKKKSRRAA